MKTLDTEHDLEKAIPFLLARAGARMGNAFAKHSNRSASA